MRRTFLTCFALLLADTSPAVAQQALVDLIPDDAAVAVILRQPNDLKKKGDKFLKDADLNIGIRPSEIFDFLTVTLGINKGIDFDRPGGAVLLRPAVKGKSGFEDFQENLYLIVPFTDLETISGKFRLPRGGLKPGKITEVDIGEPIHWALVQGKHLYLAAAESPLKRILKAKSGGAGARLSRDQKKAYDQADILLHLGIKALREEWKSILDGLVGDLGKIEDAEEKAAIKKFVHTMASVEFGLLAFHIREERDREGLGITGLFAFDPEVKEAREFLADFGNKKTPSTLAGLPEGKVVVAQAWSGDGAKNALLARAMVQYLLANVLELKRLTSPTDRPSFLGVFNEVWRRLDGNRVGVYLTSNESKLGLFSVIAILDVPEPHKLLAELRTLAKMAEGDIDLGGEKEDEGVNIAKLVSDLSSERYPVRASAHTKLRLLGEPALPYLQKAAEDKENSLEGVRRAERLIVEISRVAAERRKELLAKNAPGYIRPTFAWVSKAEKRQAQSVDIVHIKLERDEAGAEAMKQWFGPDWDKMRVAVMGKQVVVLLGSETGLLDQTLRNLRDGRPGLAEGKRFVHFAKQSGGNMAGEFHMSAGKLLALVTGGAEALNRHEAMTSFGLATGEAHIQVDLFVPSSEFRAASRQ